MSVTNKHQLVTLADLDAFKTELINVIEQAINKTKTAQTKKWLKSSEVRELIKVSPGKLQTIRETGLLSFTRIGGNIYYDEDDIMRLFENNKVKSNGS